MRYRAVRGSTIAFTAWAPARTRAGAGVGRPLVLRESVEALGSLASGALSFLDGEARRSGHFGQGGLDVIGGGDLRAGQRGGEQGVMGEEIDLARQAAVAWKIASSAGASKSGTAAPARRRRCAR